MAYDDLEFSQQSFIFFTSWEGTHLKGIKIPVDKSYSQNKGTREEYKEYIQGTRKVLTPIKKQDVVSLKPTGKAWERHDSFWSNMSLAHWRIKFAFSLFS